jgi:hypothetical protein
MLPPKLFCDEMRCPVLDPGRGQTKTGFMWAIASDDWPWGSADPPAVTYNLRTRPRWRARGEAARRLQWRRRRVRRVQPARPADTGRRRGHARLMSSPLVPKGTEGDRHVAQQYYEDHGRYVSSTKQLMCLYSIKFNVTYVMCTAAQG